MEAPKNGGTFLCFLVFIFVARSEWMLFDGLFPFLFFSFPKPKKTGPEELLEPKTSRNDPILAALQINESKGQAAWCFQLLSKNLNLLVKGSCF